MYAESDVSVSTTDFVDGGPPAPPKFATVNHLTLDTISAIIHGSPVFDIEFAVPLGGKEQYIYSHSNVVRQACPTLWKKMQGSSTVVLDSMEETVTTQPRSRPREAPSPEPEEEDFFDDVTDDFDAETATIDSVAPSFSAPVGVPEPDPEPVVLPNAAEPSSGMSTPRQPRSRSKLRWLMGGKSDDGLRDAIHDPIGTVSSRTPVQPAPAPRVGQTVETSRMRRYSKPASQQGGNPVNGGGGTGWVPPSGTGTPPPDSTPRRSSKRGKSRGSRRHGGASSESRPRPGMRRVRVLGATPHSVQALVFYFYTSQVHFVSTPHIAPQSDANSLHEEAGEQLGDGSKSSAALWPPAFSNKAAFCLGEQLDLHDLRLRAFDHLTLNISSRTVLADLLSPFGDRFSEVQDAHLDFISQHWEEVKTRPDFLPIINNLVHGQYPQSSKSLFHLFSKLSIRA